MVRIFFEPTFEKIVRKISDEGLRLRIKKLIGKIADSPEIGKPMRYGRKGTREVYVQPFRISYLHVPEEEKVVFSGIYHKDEQ